MAVMAARSGSVFLMVIVFVRVDYDRVVLGDHRVSRYVNSVSNYFLASFILYDFVASSHCTSYGQRLYLLRESSE